MRRMREDRGDVGALADVPDLRRDALLATRRLDRHASRHDGSASSHPVAASAEPGERWLYCYVDDEMADVPRNAGVQGVS